MSPEIRTDRTLRRQHRRDTAARRRRTESRDAATAIRAARLGVEEG